MAAIITSRKLTIKCTSTAENPVNLSFPCREDVNGEEVSDVANTIIGLGVFGDSDGNPLEVSDAAYVTTTTKDTLYGATSA